MSVCKMGVCSFYPSLPRQEPASSPASSFRHDRTAIRMSPFRKRLIATQIGTISCSAASARNCLSKAHQQLIARFEALPNTAQRSGLVVIKQISMKTAILCSFSRRSRMLVLNWMAASICCFRRHDPEAIAGSSLPVNNNLVYVPRKTAEVDIASNVVKASVCVITRLDEVIE
jgi:hypothetical protein